MQSYTIICKRVKNRNCNQWLLLGNEITRDFTLRFIHRGVFQNKTNVHILLLWVNIKRSGEPCKALNATQTILLLRKPTLPGLPAQAHSASENLQDSHSSQGGVPYEEGWEEAKIRDWSQGKWETSREVLVSRRISCTLRQEITGAVQHFDKPVLVTRFRSCSCRHLPSRG